ncbi:MAG: hypothetical protein IJT08_03760 [Alphaproteobacteria bacterium]|nr:hypothetical protein [Alphaproteobacteria bacterium]
MSIENVLSKVGRALDGAVSFCGKVLRRVFARKHKGGSDKAPHSGAVSPYTTLAFDSVLAFLSIFISIHLRIGMDFLDYSPAYILKNMFVFGLVSSSVFLWLQTYQSFWRHTTIEDMPPIFLSVILSNLLFFPLMMLMNRNDFLPYSVLFVNIFVLSIMLIVPRFLCRMMYNQQQSKMKRFGNADRRGTPVDIPKVLLVGSSSSIETFFGEVVANDDVTFNFEPVGILSLEQTDVGHTIRGIPVLGELRDIQLVFRELNRSGVSPKQLVISEKMLPESAKKFLIRYAEAHDLLLLHVIFRCTLGTVSE